MPDIAKDFGWVNHPDIPARAAAAPRLSDVAPHLFRDIDPAAPVYLYRAWQDVLGGKFPDYPAQQIGDCTSFGAGHSVDLTAAVQIAIGGKAEAWKESCTEAIYGMGREIANMLGGGDGCYGGAVTDAVIRGVVPRETVGPYSGSRAKQWGRSGVPAEVKSVAAAHKIKSKALLKTCDDVDAGLFNGYVGLACSDIGFDVPRDQDGVCRRRGSWAHCMSYSARRVKAGRRQYCIDQSWGPDQPQGPTSDGQPPFSFWVDEADMQAILNAQDSYLISAFDGYPGQPLPSHWTISGAFAEF